MGDQRKEKGDQNRKEPSLSASHHRGQHSNDNLADQYIREPDSVAVRFHSGHDDDPPKTRQAQNALSSPRLAPSRRKHIACPVEAMLDELHCYDKPSFNPPSGYYWVWAEDRLILTKQVKSKRIDTRIHVTPHYQGVFSLVIGEQEVIQLPTLRQAISIADHIADIFRDSLPVPPVYTIRKENGLVNIDGKEPFPPAFRKGRGQR